MIKKKVLLDCTLRDGGYINDWEFGHDNLVNVFERVVNAGIDIIEVGFLDGRREFDWNRSIMPNTKCATSIYGMLDKKSTMVVMMIDYGTCDISNLEPCESSFIDGIRVIFKKDKMIPAMEFCRQVKELGYKVFVQLVSITSYSEEELMKVINLANDIKPYAVSMVDTYGLLSPQKLNKIIKIIDNHMDPEIALGFHAHNNFQLGYVNATTVLDSGINRDVLVDGSLYGMGKSAGNAPLELIAMYMNQTLNKNYVVTDLQEAITTSILDIYRKTPWGYKLFYFIAASNGCHPDYVSYLMDKRTLSVSAINEILQRIPEEEKLTKNIKLLDQIYLDYQKRECEDSEEIDKLTERFNNKTILILGPGESIRRYAQIIKDYYDENIPVVISINYISTILKTNYLFLTNSSRYLRMATTLTYKENKTIEIIATSNVTPSSGKFTYNMNYGNLIDEKAEFPDNSLFMLLRLLMKCKCNEVTLAGFDGYTPDTINFFERDMEYSFVKDKAESLNDYGRQFFSANKNSLKVNFLTPSKYEV